MKSLDRFRGCLIGGAIGDALGYPVEFWHVSQIRERFGSRGITRYDLRNGMAQISDDTQMTLFTATALLFGETRGRMRGIGAGPVGYFGMAYRDWYFTQTKPYPLADDIHYSSWLVNLKGFFSRRAPGNTCLSALGSGVHGTIEEPINHSKGCGGVMRVAPIGLYFCDKEYWSNDDIDMAGARAAAITHGHELGYIPAAALVHIVHSLASGQHAEILPAVQDAMEAMRRLFPKASHMDELLTILQKAIDLAGQDLDDVTAIHKIGGGWVAEETLAISVYCALKYSHDFEKAMIAAVNHDGDSDSTGAVTGNILGAYLGYEALPDFYKQDLEWHDTILEIADDLYDDCRMEEYDDYRDPVWESKYIKLDHRKQ